MCVWLVPAPSPAIIPGSYMCHQNECGGKVMLENGEKTLEKLGQKSLLGEHLLAHSWNEFSGLNMTVMKALADSPSWWTQRLYSALDFAILHAWVIICSPEDPIIQELITHYVKFIWEIFWFASYFATVPLKNCVSIAAVASSSFTLPLNREFAITVI